MGDAKMNNRSSNMRHLIFQLPLRSLDSTKMSLLLSKKEEEEEEVEYYHHLLHGDCLIKHKEISKFNGECYFGSSALDSNILLGSCNGLVCLGFYDSFYLWNPKTKEVNALPKVDSFCFGDFYGFGYDSTTDDCKIILGKNSYKPVSVCISVFSLNSNSWKSVTGLDFMRLAGQACVLNGALHWLESNLSQGGVPIRRTPKIISFDLAQEKFNNKFAPIYHVVGDETTFSELQIGTTTATTDHTTSRLFVSSYTRSSYEIPIWVMQKYGDNKSWTQFLQIRLQHLPWGSPNLSLSENGEAVVKDDHYLLLYNSKKNVRVS